MDPKYIKSIAKLITTDPDVFNETTTTGGIAIPPTPLEPKTKRNRRLKKPKIDSVTGQPETGQILCSDHQILKEAQDPKIEFKPEDLGDASKNFPSQKEKDHKIDQLNDFANFTRFVPAPGWYDGNAPVKPGESREDRKIAQTKALGSYKTGNENATSVVRNIATLFSTVSVGKCRLAKDFNRFQIAVNNYVKHSKDIAKTPLSKLSPPRGWWDQEWNKKDISNYYETTVVGEVCAKYISEIKKRLEAHKCDNAECTKRNHFPELAKLVCLTRTNDEGKVELLNGYSFMDAYEEFHEQRFKAIIKFRDRIAKSAKSRSLKKLITLGSKADLDRYEAWKKLPDYERVKYSLFDLFPDTVGQFLTFYKDYPKYRADSEAHHFANPTGNENIGALHVGDRVSHPEYGLGKVVRDSPHDQGIVRVVFDDELETTSPGHEPNIYDAGLDRSIDKSELSLLG